MDLSNNKKSRLLLVGLALDRIELKVHIIQNLYLFYPKARVALFGSAVAGRSNQRSMGHRPALENACGTPW